MFDVWKSIAELRQPCLMRAVPSAALGLDGVVKEAVLKSVDETLWECAERQVLESDISHLQHQSLYTRDKWLTTSALQKSIRRGYAGLAERYARSAVHIDPNHACRRLAIIALEDIGLGDLKLIATTLALLGDKRRRQRLGEERLAAFLAKSMSEAVKSRLACEVLSLVEYDGAARKIAPSIAHLESAQLGEFIRSEGFASTPQIVALLALHGTDRLRVRTMPVKRGAGVHGLLKIAKNQRDPLIFHYIVQRGLSRCRDSLAIPYVLLGKLVDRQCFEVVDHASEDQPIMIGSYPAAAFDMHTRLGRIAIRQFGSRWREKYEAFGVRDVGNLIFALEGGLLDRRLSNPALDEIAEKAAQLEVFGEESESSRARFAALRLSPLLDTFRRQAAISVM